MKTILITHRDVAFAEQLESELRHGGYRVISCAGPSPHGTQRIRCATGFCAHRDVDLLIYDPLLTAVNARGDRYSQVIDTALAHPDIPMLLAWSPAKVPEFGTLREYASCHHTCMPPPTTPRVCCVKFTMRSFRPSSRLRWTVMMS